MILDATCAPQNIKYPQDIELLNESREKLEQMIDRICEDYSYYKPRMNRKNARKDYLALAKCRKRGGKKLRKAIRKQLHYVRRDLGYIENFMKCVDVELTEKELVLLDTIEKVYEQQLYMFENRTHSVDDRIVSISQPYRKRTGHYPERVLADTIYRNAKNKTFCQRLGVRLSGKRLGRPKKDVDKRAEKKIAYQDNTDRIEVERRFSIAKRKFGLGLLLTKREDTTRASIVLSVIAMNISRLAAMFLRFFILLINAAFLNIHLSEYCPQSYL